MRDQVLTLPGTGTTPVPVVATDLYIHGDGGWATSGINTHEIFDQGTYYTTPIDRNYAFDIHLPAKPNPTATLQWTVADAPGNNIGNAAVVSSDLSNPADPKLHVQVNLAGSGVDPERTYARQIVAGWAVPQGAVRRLRIKLTRMDLHEDMEIAGADGELSFFWLNVPKSPTEWQRLSEFEIPTLEDFGFFDPCFDHTNVMNDFDDDHGCGNGILNFNGPTFDLFVKDGQYPGPRLRPGLLRRHLWFAQPGRIGSRRRLPYPARQRGQRPLQDVEDRPHRSRLQRRVPLSVSNPDNQYTMHFTVTETDSTPPSAPSPTQSPAANGAGWNNSDVTVTWHWADNAGGSGIDTANCPPTSTSSGEGNPITLTATCKDLEGTSLPRPTPSKSTRRSPRSARPRQPRPTRRVGTRLM